MQKWKCVECNKEFAVGDWVCTDGISTHKVKEKTYRTLGASADPSSHDSSLKAGRVVVCNVPPPTRVMEGNDAKWVGEGSVEFIRGIYTTTDPIQQYWLDKKPAYNCTEAEWQAEWLSNHQRLELREMELRAREQRLENDRNDLLAQTKRKVGAA